MDIQTREPAFKTTVNVPQSVSNWCIERGIKLTNLIKIAPGKIDQLNLLVEECENMRQGIRRRDEALGNLSMENDRLRTTLERLKEARK